MGNIKPFPALPNRGQLVLLERLETIINATGVEYHLTPIEIMGALEIAKINMWAMLPKDMGV